jgi:hypothetical protein
MYKEELFISQSSMPSNMEHSHLKCKFQTGDQDETCASPFLSSSPTLEDVCDIKAEVVSLDGSMSSTHLSPETLDDCTMTESSFSSKAGAFDVKSLLWKSDDGAGVTPGAQDSFFFHYVQDMLDLALCGDVSDFFGPGVSDEAQDATVEVATTVVAQAAELSPCSRPTFRKLLRPRAVPRQEEFSMQCLQSTTVCLEAPKGPDLEVWAERLSSSVITEDTPRVQAYNINGCSKTALLHPMSDSRQELHRAVGKEKVERRSASLPSSSLSLQKPAKSTTPREPIIPGPCIDRAAAHVSYAGESNSPDIEGETDLWAASQRISSGAAKQLYKFAAPTPPSEPAPGARASSYRRPRGMHYMVSSDATEKSTVVVLQGMLEHRKGTVVPQLPKHSPPHPLTNIPRGTFSMETNAGSGTSSKSAMEIDLGGVAAVHNMGALWNDPQLMSFDNSQVRIVSARKSGSLPPLPQLALGNMSISSGAWRSHDII